LDAVGEDLNPDVVAHDAVGPVHDCVDQALEPRIARDAWSCLEDAAFAQPLPLGHELVDLSRGTDDLVRERALESDVSPVLQRHPRAEPRIGVAVAKHPHDCVGVLTLRSLIEEQARGHRDASPAIEQVPCEQHLTDARRSQCRCVGPKLGLIEILDSQLHRGSLVGCGSPVIGEFLPLGGAELA